MKKVIIVASLITMLFSCQKEISTSPYRPINIDSVQELITRQVVTSLADNLVWLSNEFAYDTLNRLVLRTDTFRIKDQNGMISVRPGMTQFFYDNLNRIVRARRFPDTTRSMIIAHYENASSLKMTSTVMVSTVAGNIVTDSTAFSYDADNRIAKSATFSLVGPSSAPWRMENYVLFQYDNAGNMLQRKIFNRNAANGYDVNITYNFEYDSNSNPLYNPGLCWMIWDPGWPMLLSPNNIIKQKNDYPDPLSLDDEVVYQYQYDSQKRPVTQQKMGDPNNITNYFYR